MHEGIHQDEKVHIQRPESDFKSQVYKRILYSNLKPYL